MQSYWSALQFAPTNLPVFYRGMPQASHGISVGKCFCPTRLTECQAKPCPWPDIRQAYRKKLFAGLTWEDMNSIN